MIATNKPLHSLTAADVMSQVVVMIPQEMTLRSAAHLLLETHVSGAPVVDGAGRCIGVVSLTDFARWADNGGFQTPAADPSLDAVCEWEMEDFHHLPMDEVKSYMTADPVTASPGTLLSSVARMMIDAGIHRVIIVNEHGQPLGIVSSTDIVAAVARS